MPLRKGKRINDAKRANDTVGLLVYRDDLCEEVVCVCVVCLVPVLMAVPAEKLFWAALSSK